MNVQTTFPQAALASEQDMANAIRALAMDAVEKAKSGHPGMPMGMADVAAVLFNRFIRIDPAHPDWPDRDRFILSAGHGSMLQYAIHYLLGYEDMPVEELARFRQLGARTAGHPEYGHAMGIETTTGPLGQGLATAVGMALAERMMAARFGAELVDHYTYVIAGDGCLMEGISHEAIDLAGHLGLSRLIVFWDDNRITIDGATSLATSMDQPARFQAAGWHTEQVDGHDLEAIAAAIDAARRSDKPSLIACRTVIGKGAPNLQGSEKTHGAPLGAAEIEAARENLGWAYPPFIVPEPILAAWRAVAKRGASERRSWTQRLTASPLRASFEQALNCDVADAIALPLADFRAEHIQKATKVATRKASEMVLGIINTACDMTVGGSADLTHSNLTITKGMAPVRPDDFSGRYIHYGIREHGMAAAMNGLALHGGFIPYGGTFLAFADYARGAMRLSALMSQRVIYVMTHELDRPRRRRPDASADRASRHASRHTQSQRVPPGRHHRDGGGVGARARRRGPAERAGAVAAGPADAARPAHHAEPLCARRLSHQRCRRPPRRDPDRHRLGSANRQGGRRGAVRAVRHPGRRGLDALLGAVRRAGCRISGLRARLGAAGGNRGCGPAGLGPLDR